MLAIAVLVLAALLALAPLPLPAVGQCVCEWGEWDLSVIEIGGGPSDAPLPIVDCAVNRRNFHCWPAWDEYRCGCFNESTPAEDLSGGTARYFTAHRHRDGDAFLFHVRDVALSTSSVVRCSGADDCVVASEERGEEEEWPRPEALGGETWDEDALARILPENSPLVDANRTRCRCSFLRPRRLLRLSLTSPRRAQVLCDRTDSWVSCGLVAEGEGDEGNVVTGCLCEVPLVTGKTADGDPGSGRDSLYRQIVTSTEKSTQRVIARKLVGEGESTHILILQRLEIAPGTSAEHRLTIYFDERPAPRHRQTERPRAVHSSSCLACEFEFEDRR